MSIRHSFIIWVSLVLAVLDRLGKIASLSTNDPLFQLGRLFEFHQFKNSGAAFSLPIPTTIIITVTLVVFFLLLLIAKQSWSTNKTRSLVCITILVGAFGNLLDRILYGYTVDYLIFFERSAINISDIIIVCGSFLLLFNQKPSEKPVDNQ